MDRELNRSVRILEDALSAHGKSLIRTPGTTPKRSKLSPMLDLSLTIDPHEMKRMMDKTNMSMLDNTLNNVLQNHSVMGSIITNNKPWENAVSSLYMEFLEIIQARTNTSEVFETVMDLARCCTDTLNVIRGMKSIKVRKDEEQWLENERNTWRLVYCLYQDRVNSVGQDDEVMPYLGVSEKLCVQNLYKRDALVRESQLVIDWLESNAVDGEDEPRMQHFTDKNFGWENTLHQLVSPENIVFRSSRNIVTSLDPDAPLRQGLPLHDLDAEDDERLSRDVFAEVRRGRLADAQRLCLHCGQPWRASLLEGWRLYHNRPTDDTGADDADLTVQDLLDQGPPRERRCLEGNANRDAWKLFALKYCDKNNINIHQRAALAAFCGHLRTLLLVSSTWEDYLWSYMKTMVDIRVESEIRDYVAKDYKKLPPEYWDNRMSLDEIFDKIAATKDPEVMEQANSRDHLIQKYIILDQIPQLMIAMEGWIDAGGVQTQFLRFLAHLVLFFKQIGVNQRDDIGNKVLETYVQSLMEMRESQILAYYVATLGEQKQVQLYASYLEEVTDNDERQRCLKYGKDVGLDVKAVARQVVENIRNRPEDLSTFGNLQKSVTESDLEKICALDWVLFHPGQRVDALYQCNALVCYFLTMGKIDAAKAAFGKVPAGSVDAVLSGYEDGAPESVHQIVREHLSYKTYLDAQEAFNNWFKYFHHSRPAPPAALPDNASFTEKVAHEHRVSQHRAETERWRLTVTHLAKTARTMLYNVLLFPDGGWLSGLKHCEHLRQTCVPETVVLLYSVLAQSDEHAECLQLADVLASEKYQLYKVYNKEQLENILKKFFESSIKLLDQNKDMWGNVVGT